MDEPELIVKKSDVQSRRLSLIDVSSEDDSLVNSNAGDLRFSISEDQENQSFQFSEATASNNLEDVPENFELCEQITQPCEPIVPEMTKRSSKCNLRKSLAWDSAFFTSAGVLDPEELSSMIEGEKMGKQMLPGIQEEIHRSTDSVSTLESETSTLEISEGNLFEDVRASIQKSSKASSSVDESMKGSIVAETNIDTSAKVDFASQDKVMPRFASKNPSMKTQRPGKMKKPSTRPQVPKSVSARAESTTSLTKQTKVLGKPHPSPTALTKRASLGSNLVKVEKDNVKSATGRGAILKKLPPSSRLVPKPGPLSRSVSSGSSPTAKREAASSSFERSGNNSSNNVGKSPFNPKRKIDSKTENPPSSGSTRKTPSRIEPRNRSQLAKSHMSTNLVPGTKMGTCTPADSVSDWSSESSSSVFALKKMQCSPRASLDIRSSRSSSLDSDAPEILDFQNHAFDQSSTGDETQVTGLHGQCVEKAPMGKYSALPPLSKPSGLRLPSPKIGFFDGVKSVASSPNGSMQPHPVITSGLPRSLVRSVGLSGGQNKEKLGKLQPVGNVAKLGNKKPDAQKTSFNTKPKSPVPLQQASNAAKVLSPSKNSISPKVPSEVPRKAGRENQLKDAKIGTEGHGMDIDGEENCAGVFNESPAFKKEKLSPALKGHSNVKAAKVTPIDGGSTTISDSSSICADDKITLSEKVSEDATYELIERVSEDATYELINFKQEESSHFEDQLDSLSRQVGAVDINKETQQMLVADSLS